MVTTFDKALAGVIVPVIVAALVHFGFNASDEFTVALTAVVTGLVVWLVPNKDA